MRYVAMTGSYVFAESNDLMYIIKWIGTEFSDDSDIVVWDRRDNSIAASNCRGWLTINAESKVFCNEKFNISFTNREMQVFKRFLEIWKLEDGQTVLEAIEDIYNQPYVKYFKPKGDQIRLERDEFKVFVNKLLNITRSKIECVS